MENRITPNHHERRGGALTALAAILVITAAWWALAVWPAGAMEPEWLARTRAACFGSRRGGLPDAGGWILLIGEPVGMLAMLLAIWGGSLRKDVAWITTRRAGRFALTSAVVVLVAATTLLGMRTVRAWAAVDSVAVVPAGLARRIDVTAPTIELVDQRGFHTSLADLRGRTAILTFAYGHCLTMCPSIVNDLHAARRKANRMDAPILVVTLDPWRDTPERLPTLAGHWELREADRVFSGSVADVEQVLDQLGIGRGRNEVTGDIDHATTVMILDGTGRITWRVDGGAFRVSELLGR